MRWIEDKMQSPRTQPQAIPSWTHQEDCDDSTKKIPRALALCSALPPTWADCVKSTLDDSLLSTWIIWRSHAAFLFTTIIGSVNRGECLLCRVAARYRP